MPSDSFLTKTPEETQSLAKKILEKGLFEDENTLVILLKGKLGAGKTTFCKGIAKALGIEKAIKSPTYTYSNHYAFEKNGKTWQLIHFDLYRLPENIENPEQTSAEIGLEEALHRSNTLVLIEWPERLEIERATLKLSFSTEDEGHRIEVA